MSQDVSNALRSEVTSYLESNHTLSEYVSVELCAGSGVLSLHLKAEGLHIVPVDYIRNSHSSHVPSLVLDLSISSQADIIIQLIAAGMVVFIHAGVPCGTCSRAREIPLRGSHSPKPLRSELCPMGLPNLNESDQARIDKANSVYLNCARIIDEAIRKNIFVTIENPRNSLL